MKLAPLDNPVRASWLTEQGRRLDPGPFVSDAYQARKFVESLPNVEPLSAVTERIFHPGIFRRQWTTDPEHGVPFLGSAAIFQADLSNLPFLTTVASRKSTNFALKPGWALITRSGMTAGRVTYSRLEMDGFSCSEDVMRVVPNTQKIPAGYLYTFLASDRGRAMIRGGIYGTSVKHIEPEHIADLPLPRLHPETESKIDDLIQQAMKRRSQFHEAITNSTIDLFRSAGLEHLANIDWHSEERDTDFVVQGPTPLSLRALNFTPRARRIFEQIRSVPHTTLGQVCDQGVLRTGARFKRIESDSTHGVRLIGQRQAFWIRPEGRWINPTQAPADIRQTDETILIAAHGTLGETEVFGRSVLVTGSWLKHAYSQDFVRVASGDPDYPGAYLFALLRSNPAFRMLRSMSVGGKQQEYHPQLLRDLPIPACTPEDRERIAETVRQAFRWRDEADMKEDEALTLLDDAVREAAR